MRQVVDVIPGQTLTRPPEPLPKRDPAPSRWRYRLSRLMLTPLFRSFLKVGLPVFFLLFIGGVWLSSEANRQTLSDAVAEAKSSIQQRPEFMVKLMAVDGADDALVANIRDAVPIDFPQSSFDIDLEAERAKIAALPAVKSATARIRPGGILQVDVVQRVPIAVWRGGSGLSLIDETGTLVGPLAARGDRPDLPLIAGDGAKLALAEAMELYGAVGPLTPRFRGLVRMGERRWDVVLDRGQRLMLPADDPVQSLRRIIAMDQARDMLDRDIAAVDMRNPDRPTVRMTRAAADAFRLPATQISQDN